MRRQNFRPVPGPPYPIPAVVNPNPPIDPGMMIAIVALCPAYGTTVPNFSVADNILVNKL